MSSAERRILGRWGKYTVRRFCRHHAAMIEQRAFDVKSPRGPQEHYTGVSIFKGREIAACMGVRPLWGGVGEGWVLTSELVSECPKLLTSITLRCLDWLHRNQGYHRIGAHVSVNFTAAIAWAKALGFEIEGYAPGYGPGGEDFIHFGRVWA